MAQHSAHFRFILFTSHFVESAGGTLKWFRKILSRVQASGLGIGTDYQAAVLVIENIHKVHEAPGHVIFPVIHLVDIGQQYVLEIIRQAYVICSRTSGIADSVEFKPDYVLRDRVYRNIAVVDYDLPGMNRGMITQLDKVLQHHVPGMCIQRRVIAAFSFQDQVPIIGVTVEMENRCMLFYPFYSG